MPNRLAKAKNCFGQASCGGSRDSRDPAYPWVLSPKKGQTRFPKCGRGGRGGLPVLLTVGEEFTKPDAARDDRMEAQGKAIKEGLTISAKQAHGAGRTMERKHKYLGSSWGCP